MNSITPHTPLDNLQRRTIARDEMAQFAGLGKFMYLLHSPHVRKGLLPNGKIGHSIIDLIRILSDTKSEPRFLWRDLKARLIREDEDTVSRISHISLPLWNDASGRQRSTEVVTTGGMVLVIMELHSKTSNAVRSGILDMYDKYASEYHDQILEELERTVGWAGTRIRLEMQSIYEPGDYDNPDQPPGSPK